MKTRKTLFHLTAMVFVIVMVIIGCSTSPEEKKIAHYNNGMQFLNDGQYNAAVIEFRNAVQIDPSFAEARYQLGLAYLKTNQPGNALSEFDAAADLDPSNLNALIKAGELYLLARQVDESHAAIRKSFEVDPDFPDSHALLARIELVEGRWASALEAINHALALNPDKGVYYIIKGQALAAAEQLEEAESAFKKGVEVEPTVQNLKALIGFYTIWNIDGDPEDTILKALEQQSDIHELYLELASFYASRKRMDQAEEYILAAVEKEPLSSDLRIYLGNFYFRSGQPDKAEKAYLEALANEGDPVRAKAVLADYYFKTRQFELASEMAGSVLEKEPEHALASLVEAKLLVRAQKNTRALAILDRLTADFPRWGEVYYQKGVAHLNRGEIQLSYRAADTALKHSPGNPEALTLMAHHLMLQGKYDEAKAAALDALQATPGSIRAGIVLARSMVQLDEVDRAIRLLEDMADHAPENIEIRFYQAEAYIAGDKITQALATYEKVLHIDPDFRPALAAIVQSYIKAENHDKAIMSVRSQRLKSPENPHYMIMLAGLVNNYESSTEEALALLAEARKKAPDIPVIYSMAADIHLRQGNFEEAINHYQTMVQQKPDAIEGYMALGSLHDQLGNKDEAMKAYALALEIQPGFAPAANNLAWLIAKSERPDLAEALRFALIAKDASPEDPHIADTLGYIHYRRGAYQLAMPQFQQAIAKRPDMPVFRYHLALALHADGQAMKAKESLKQALELKEDFPEKEQAASLLSDLKSSADTKSGP